MQVSAVQELKNQGRAALQRTRGGKTGTYTAAEHTTHDYDLFHLYFMNLYLFIGMYFITETLTFHIILF